MRPFGTQRRQGLRGCTRRGDEAIHAVRVWVAIGSGDDEADPVQAGPAQPAEGGAVGLCAPGRTRHRPGVAVRPLGSALGGGFGALELAVAALRAGWEELSLFQGQHVAALAAFVAGVGRRFLEARKAFGVHGGSFPGQGYPQPLEAGES